MSDLLRRLAFRVLTPIIIFGLGITACSNDSPVSPSPDSVQTFTANLNAVNEVPPISGAEAGVSGTARLTFNLTRSASGAIDTATLDLAVNASGFPTGTALTNAHPKPSFVKKRSLIVTAFSTS